MKKIVSLVLAVIMLLSVCAFASAEDKLYAGVTLNVLGNSSTPSTFMQEHLAEFEAETGIKVNYEQLTNDQLNTKILVSMAGGGSDLDVYMYMAYQNTKMYVQNGWLEPLDSYITDDFDVADFLESGITMSSVDGKLYGVPHGSEYTLIFYNKTMIEEAGIDVNAIKTYDDLLEACKTVEEKLPGIHGIALRGQGNGSVTIVICVARAYGGDYFDANGSAAINSEAFCKGVEMYRNLLQYAQEGSSTMSWSETCNVFAQKQTAFRMDSDAQYPYLIDPSSSLVSSDELGFFALPAGDAGQATTCGNWSIGISYGSKNKAAAWEFIRWMNSKEACLKLAQEQGGVIARASVLADDEIMAKYPAGYADAIKASAKIATGGALPNMTYSSEARTALGEALDAIYAGDDIQSNLDEASAVMQELLDQEAEEKAE